MYGKLFIVLIAILGVVSAVPHSPLELSCEKCKTLVDYTNKLTAAAKPYKGTVEKICETNIQSNVSVALCKEYVDKTFKYFLAETDADIQCYLTGSCPKPDRIQDESPELDCCRECVKAINQVKEFLAQKLVTFVVYTDLICEALLEVSGMERVVCRKVAGEWIYRIYHNLAKIRPHDTCAAMRFCKRF